MILERKGEYTQAVDLAQYYAEDYDHDMEMDEGNQGLVEKFKEIVERCTPRIGEEQDTRR